MSRIVYDVSMALGTLLCSVGAGLIGGLGVGLVTAGGLTIVLTIVGVFVSGRR